MANPNYTVIGRNVAGYLEEHSSWTPVCWNVGNSTGNRLGYIDGTVVSSMAVRSMWRAGLQPPPRMAFPIPKTGGTITLNTVENPRDLYASFDIRPIDNSTFNMSGGKIVFANMRISAAPVPAIIIWLPAI